MSIAARCTTCGKHYNLNERFAGQRVVCKDCGQGFQVPPAAAQAPSRERPVAARAPAARPSTMPAAAQRTPPAPPSKTQGDEVWAELFDAEANAPPLGPTSAPARSFNSPLPRHVSPRRRAKVDMTPAALGAFCLALIGLATFVLPLLGRLNFLGEAQPIVAAAFTVLGAALLVVAWNERLDVAIPTAGGALALLAILWLVVPFAGPSEAELAVQDGIALMEDMADILADIESKEDVAGAMEDLQELAEDAKAMQEKYADVKPTKEELDELTEAYRGELEAAGERIRDEVVRIARLGIDLPGAAGGLGMLGQGLQLPNGDWAQLDEPRREVAGGAQEQIHGMPGLQMDLQDRNQGMIPGMQMQPLPGMGGGPPTPGGFEFGIDHLVREYGRDRVVTLKIDGVPNGLFNYVVEHSQKLARASAQTSFGGADITVHMAPVDDLQGLAARIDFGRVVATDPAARLIEIEADPALLPDPLAEAVTNPLDREFYDQNLADLSSWDSNRRREAADRLKNARPNERKAEIAEALVQMLSDEDLGARRSAVAALAVWGDSQCVPAVIEALADEDHWLVEEAIKTLQALKDPRACEPVALLLERHAGPAAQFLKSMGAAAEPAVLEACRSRNPGVRNQALDVLDTIGTEAAIPPLLEMLDTEDDVWALDKVRKLLVKSQDERVVVPITRLLETDRFAASQLIVQLGAMAEDEVLKYVKHPDGFVQLEAINILGQIGTEKSVKPLQHVARLNDGWASNAASEALRAIEDRVRAVADE